MIDDETRAKAFAQVQGLDKAPASDYEAGWDADEEMPSAQAAADSGVAMGKKMDADPDFNFDEPTAAPVKAAEVVEKPIKPMKAEEPAKAMSFREKFKAELNAGAKDFEWNGKRYTTALKKPAAAKTSTPSTNASPAAKPATAAATDKSPSLSQKLGADYIATKAAAENMPAGTSSTARQALNNMVGTSQKAYEQAAAAEKSGTSVARQPSAPAKTPMKFATPADGEPMLNIPGGTTLAQGRDPRKAN